MYKKVKDIKKYKLENNLSKPVIKIQGIWPAISENPTAFYEALAPYVDQVAFNPLIDEFDKVDNIKYIDNFSCPQQYQRLTIGADGLVMKCANDENNKDVIGDANKETVHSIWHGEKMTKVREMHNEKDGFLKSEVCRSCYLPRETYEEEAKVNNRKILVHNYCGVDQKIGESEF